MRDSKKNAVFIAILLVLLMISSAIVNNIMSTNDSFVHGRNKCKYNIRDEKENTLDVRKIPSSFMFWSLNSIPLLSNHLARPSSTVCASMFALFVVGELRNTIWNGICAV